MQLRTSRAVTAIAVLLVALLVAACGGTTTSGAPSAAATSGASEAAPSEGAAQVERLRMATVSDESTLNPYTYVTGFPGWNLLMLQYDAIMHLDADGVPQPWLASAVTASDDGTQYTVDLRDGVTFNDGTPLTSADIAFTVEYFKTYPQSRFTASIGSATVETPSPTQAVFTLPSANPSFPLRTLADVPILPKHIWETITNPDEFQFATATNVGSGPFKMVEYQPEQFYRFEANNDYFAGPPSVAELVIVQFADDAGALAALRSEEVDMIVRPVAPEQIDILSAESGIKVIKGPQFTTSLLTYDTTKAPFDRLEVRQAVAKAIDRQELIDTVYLGGATPGNLGWIHPLHGAYNDAVQTVTDVAAANALLDGIGAIDTDGDGIRELDGAPLAAEMLVRSTDPLALRTGELVREMLLQIGFDAAVAAVELETHQAKVWPDFNVANGRDYTFAVWGWSAPVQADPGRINQLIDSDPTIGTLNLSGFADEEADALSAALMAEGDPTARQVILDDIQALIAEKLPLIMLYYPDGAYAYRSDVYDGWQFITGQGVVDKTSLLPPEARP